MINRIAHQPSSQRARSPSMTTGCWSRRAARASSSWPSFFLVFVKLIDMVLPVAGVRVQQLEGLLIPSDPPTDRLMTWWMCHPVSFVIFWPHFGQSPSCQYHNHAPAPFQVGLHLARQARSLVVVGLARIRLPSTLMCGFAAELAKVSSALSFSANRQSRRCTGSTGRSTVHPLFGCRRRAQRHSACQIAWSALPTMRVAIWLR